MPSNFEGTNTLSNLFSTTGFFGLLNYLIILLQILYVIYAFVITRQVVMLNRSFKTEAAWLFTIVSWAHLFGSIILVIISVLSL